MISADAAGRLFVQNHLVMRKTVDHVFEEGPVFGPALFKITTIVRNR
jgi:hypothetical protein